MKKNTIISGALFIVLGVGLIFLAKNSSYALEESRVSVSMDIDCDKYELKPGEQTTCELNGFLDNMSTTAMSSNMLDLSSDLELVSITKGNDWQGQMEKTDSSVQLYAEENLSYTTIMSFTIKAKETAKKDQMVKINNMKLYKTDIPNYVTAAVSKTVYIDYDGEDDDETDYRSANNNISRLEVIGANSSYTLENEFSATTLECFVDETSTTAQINAELADSEATFVEGFGPRTVELNKEDETQNEFPIKVQAENGDIAEYTIKVGADASYVDPADETPAADPDNPSGEGESSSGTTSTNQGQQIVNVPNTAAFSPQLLLALGVMVLVIGAGIVIAPFVQEKINARKQNI